MEDNEKKKVRIRKQSLILMPLILMAVACFFCFLGYFIMIASGIPNHLHMPPEIRGLGIIMMAIGFFFLCWMFRYRKLSDFLNSTYLSMQKTLMRTRLDDASKRIEPLILQGPQKHVRHPTYFSIVAIIFGLWLALDHTFLLFMAFLLFLWFNLVIYFEEKELKALYKGEYEAYAGSVPRFFPSLKSGRWH